MIALKKVCLVSFLALSLGACGKPSGPTSSAQQDDTFTVTFHNNIPGGEDVFKTETVEKGEKVTRPATDPVREGYVFRNWYKDAGEGKLYDFDTGVYKNTNLYAGWLEIFNIEFDLNYSGAPKMDTVQVIEGQKLAEPATDPTRDGFAFVGWKSDKNSPQYFDFGAKVYEAVTLYAEWGPVGSKRIKTYVFEAEYCPCITDGVGMNGATYSGASQGKNLIQKDTEEGDADASNGYWVHHLYQKDNTLVFEIESDVAVDNAVIYWRLSAEYVETVLINNTLYKFKLNDVEVLYDPITFIDVPEQGTGFKKFADYLVGTNLNLKAGTNKIELITDNVEHLYGTANSTAPMVDCIKIFCSSQLTWPGQKTSNIEIGDDE